MLFFFFSSRRRHTRWNCDWSSDVCSSDLVARESQREGIDDWSQFRATKEGILGSAAVLRQDDVGLLISREITGIDAEPAPRRRRVREVQPHIARHQIGTAIVVEVPGGEAEPPAARGIETRAGRDVA